MLQFWHFYFAPVGNPWWQGAVYGNILASALLSGGILWGVYRKIECNEKHCYRIAHHPVKNTSHKTCSKHATKEVHDRLTQNYKRKHPEAHTFLKSV